MIQKSILKSKTFWLQVATVLSAMIPAVQAWLAANPVEFLAVLAAVNVIVRFVTSGKVNVFSDADSVRCIPFAMVAAGAAVGLGMALPSCSPAQISAAREIPIKGCVTTDQGTVCYSSKGGLSYEVDTRSAK